jgi:hypothetical protein
MIFRAGLTLLTVLLGVAGLIPNQAHAGLIGPGTTVQAFYYNGTFTGPEGQDWVDNMGNITSLPAPLTAPVDFLQGAASGSYRARPADRRSTSATPRLRSRTNYQDFRSALPIPPGLRASM